MMNTISSLLAIRWAALMAVLALLTTHSAFAATAADESIRLDSNGTHHAVVIEFQDCRLSLTVEDGAQGTLSTEGGTEVMFIAKHNANSGKVNVLPIYRQTYAHAGQSIPGLRLGEPLLNGERPLAATTWGKVKAIKVIASGAEADLPAHTFKRASLRSGTMKHVGGRDSCCELIACHGDRATFCSSGRRGCASESLKN
jgi:hypothetical protein